MFQVLFGLLELALRFGWVHVNHWYQPRVLVYVKDHYTPRENGGFSVMLGAVTRNSFLLAHEITTRAIFNSTIIPIGMAQIARTGPYIHIVRFTSFAVPRYRRCQHDMYEALNETLTLPHALPECTIKHEAEKRNAFSQMEKPARVPRRRKLPPK